MSMPLFSALVFFSPCRLLERWQLVMVPIFPFCTLATAAPCFFRFKRDGIGFPGAHIELLVIGDSVTVLSFFFFVTLIS